METREIDRSQWNAYMAQVSNLCLNRPVTVEVSSENLGDQMVANHVPFLGIAPELKGSEACAVDIELGRIGSTDAYLHEIPLAKRVMVRESDDGRPLALDIEGEDPETHVRIKTVITWD
jgi:hypothetical protein